MATTYSKTADGQNEIDTRARRLTPRARSMLILVDGKRSDADLAKLVQQADETLQALLEAGLIEVVEGAAPKAVAAAREAAAPAPPPPPDMPVSEFMALRQEAVRAITDLLGPQAETLALRIERSADVEQLRAALERAVAYIANARGGGAAAQFAGRFLAGPLA